MSMFKDIAVYILVMSALLLGTLAIVSIPMNMLASNSCAAVSDQMKRTAKYTFWTQCMIQQQDGSWVPLQSFRSITP